MTSRISGMLPVSNSRTLPTGNIAVKRAAATSFTEEAKCPTPFPSPPAPRTHSRRGTRSVPPQRHPRCRCRYHCRSCRHQQDDALPSLRFERRSDCRLSARGRGGSREMWQDIAREHPGDMPAQLRSWLAKAAECVVADDRGCDLANAAVELTQDGHPARRLIEDLKNDHRHRLAALCRAAGIVSRRCWPIPSRCCSKARASLARPPAAKARARNSSEPRKR